MADRTDGLEQMTATRRRRLILFARTIAGFTVLGAAVGLWLSTVDHVPTDIGLLLAFALFPVVGYLMATRRPDNSLSWLMLGIGATIGLSTFLGSFAGYAVHGGIGGRELGLIAVSLSNPMWVPVVGLPVTFLLLLFPDGHLPTRRWRWFACILAASLVIDFLVIVLAPGRFGDEVAEFANYRNPLGVEGLRTVLSVAIVSLAMLPIGVIGSLVALVRRFRRSAGIERLQLRWLVTAATIVAVLYTLALLIGFAGSWASNDQPGWMTVLQNVAVFSFGLIPIAIGVSVLRYHLFDIDVVINRAVLFGALAVFITVVYVAVVVGVGALVGSRGNPILSAAAAAIVALAFQLARARAQRSPTGWSTASAPRRTRCFRSSPNGSATRTRTKSSCRGWRARSPAAPGRCAPTCGSASGTSSSRRGRGHRTPRSCRLSPRAKRTEVRCPPRRCESRSGIRASSSARCRS
jgi:MFS family permease